MSPFGTSTTAALDLRTIYWIEEGDDEKFQKV